MIKRAINAIKTQNPGIKQRISPITQPSTEESTSPTAIDASQGYSNLSVENNTTPAFSIRTYCLVNTEPPSQQKDDMPFNLKNYNLFQSFFNETLHITSE